jgi:hypothetical protein
MIIQWMSLADKWGVKMYASDHLLAVRYSL